MFSEAHKTMLQTHGVLVGRILLGILFLFSGIGILFIGGPANTATYFESAGIPLAGLVVWLVIALKLVAGTALIVGCAVEKSAAALILFTIGATLVDHMDINDGELFKNLAIIGGLLYVMAYGAGDGWKLGVKSHRLDTPPHQNNGPQPTL